MTVTSCRARSATVGSSPPYAVPATSAHLLFVCRRLSLMTYRRVRAVVATRHDLMQQLFVSCHPEHGLCADPSQYALCNLLTSLLFVFSHSGELVPAIRSASGRRSSGWYVVCALVEVTTRPTPCNARTHHTGGDHRRQDSVRLSGPSGLRQMSRSYVRFASLRRWIGG